MQLLIKNGRLVNETGSRVTAVQFLKSETPDDIEDLALDGSEPKSSFFILETLRTGPGGNLTVTGRTSLGEQFEITRIQKLLFESGAHATVAKNLKIIGGGAHRMILDGKGNAAISARVINPRTQHQDKISVLYSSRDPNAIPQNFYLGAHGTVHLRMTHNGQAPKETLNAGPKSGITEPLSYIKFLDGRDESAKAVRVIPIIIGPPGEYSEALGLVISASSQDFSAAARPHQPIRGQFGIDLKPRA